MDIQDIIEIFILAAVIFLPLGYRPPQPVAALEKPLCDAISFAALFNPHDHQQHQ